MASSDTNFDVIVVGAGISGINAGYRLQTEVPDSSYCILEARGAMGGTWDLFKYPGIRSDSDLHTFGFPWRPWTEEKAIADGPSIVNYIRETAAMFGIDKHINYNHKVTSFNWSTDQQAWNIEVEVDEKKKRFTGKFIIMSTGYYDYDNPLPTTIPGLENFKGQVVHPQFWPEDLDYAGKKIVIVGSGATAVTLLPNLAETAQHVTMLQRSPGYLLNMPAVDPSGAFVKRWFPEWFAHKFLRLKFLILPFLFFNFCRTFPNAARRALKRRTNRELPKNIPHDPHFNPSYNPWEQRMCVAPDGDFYQVLREERASIATGHIKTVTEHGITLESGEQLDADIIITATGLKIQIAGGAKVTLDGQPIKISDKFLWKGIMLQDLPNACFVLGYTNASWTLGADTCVRQACRILNHMKESGSTSVIPTLGKDEHLEERPVLNLNSTYVKRAAGSLPKAGDSGPWQARKNYFSDLWQAKFGNITTGLQFYRVST